MVRIAPVALLVSIAFSLPALAQTGSIDGIVKDPFGAALTSATVTVAGPVSRSATTRADGRFHVADLPAGAYVVGAEASGFGRREQANVVVRAGGVTEVALSLPVVVKETVVVTASKAASSLANAPATMTVIGPDMLVPSPAQNYGDLLRNVPGLNVIQTSARDINLSSRQATTLLANSQLALLDGRTIYSDFFNLIFWDLVPANTSDIKQIEVVRGPAAAIWGANAATGVVNIITKAPREAPRGTFSLTGGGFSRDAGDTKGKSPGVVFGANASFARAPNDRWSYRASAGYFDSDAFPRPTGVIPLAADPLDPTVIVGGGSYADPAVAFANRGTRQPKFDLRVDQELAGGGRIDYSGGIAASQGIIHTPIGPFELEKDSYLGYLRIAYDKGGLKLAGFANILDGKAPNLVRLTPEGQPLRIDFKTQTYDVEAGYSHLVGGRHLLTFGGNARRNNFDISITPAAKDRSEVGAYLQDEIVLGAFRLAASGRVDKFGNLSDPFFSPRLMLMYKPTRMHSLRVSFNRAFRAPSAVDNYLDISILGGYFPLGALDPRLGDAQFPIVFHSEGTASLKPESLNAYEVGYTGTLANRTTVGLAFYLNESANSIANTSSASALAQIGVEPYYSSANPPPGWPLPPQVLDLLALQGIRFPALFKTVNLGGVRNEGFEASVDHAFNGWLTGFVNYSYQKAPQPLGPAADPLRYPLRDLSIPPQSRFNAGLNLNHARYIGSLSVNYADKAFWADVLDDPEHGYTSSYTLVNASFGVRWHHGNVTTTVKATNLTNENIQQHIFGDILKRTLVAEVRLAF